MKTPVQDEARRRYWRSLDELAETPEGKAALAKEFGDDGPPDEVSRRTFLGIMGAAFALSGLAGCSRPVSRILPYSKMPEDLVVGIPQQYATAWDWRGSAQGLLVTAYEGRPTKIEGNPSHPVSRGKTDLFAQASILQMYDPDRAQQVTHAGERSDWSAFTRWATDHFGTLGNLDGQGLAFLVAPTASPFVRDARSQVSRAFPRASWTTWEPVNRDAEAAGANLAFGRDVRTHVDYARANVILSLDADFLAGTDPTSVPASRGFAEGRRLEDENDSMNRLYAVEARFSLTGAMADHRLRVSHGGVGPVAAALAGALLAAPGVQAGGLDAEALRRAGSGAGLSEEQQHWVEVAARDLAANRGRAVVVAGRTQPAEVHALVHALNRALGAVGPVVRYTRETIPGGQDSGLADLAARLRDGSVDTLVVIGANPAQDAPGDLDFAAAMEGAPHVVHLGLYRDETGVKAEWQLPRAHFLETWGDAEALDGTRSLQQPLIAPLYDGKSEAELLGLLLGKRDNANAGYTLLREFYRRSWGAGGFEARWDTALHDGHVPSTAWSEESIRLDAGRVNRAWATREAFSAPSAGSLELVFREDDTVYDGRFANLAWLQELPDPMNKLTWDNAALLSPATAKELGVETEDLVRISSPGGASVEAPVWVQPGHADGVVTLTLGYGRTAAGRVADGVGVDVNPLRRSDRPWSVTGATVAATGVKYRLASTQSHWSMEERPLAREATLDYYQEHPHFTEHMEHDFGDITAYTDREYDFDEGYQWGMSIDLSTCSGCNACMVACQSENNIATVGKDQVLRGREMHWIRLDRYFDGDEHEPRSVQQPVPCQQCENAPCESVCPVNATVHSDEGLNDMVYNRCIGTRYCANNCPYKVRRFNFYDYNDGISTQEQMQKNPNVTVRMRGVMEKCTFCVQRINRARIDAKIAQRSIADGEVVTACAQACPTDAIVFGDTNDPSSRVSRVKAGNRNYAMLGWLNTKPRTTYLSRIRNPNPELEHHS